MSLILRFLGDEVDAAGKFFYGVMAMARLGIIMTRLDFVFLICLRQAWSYVKTYGSRVRISRAKRRFSANYGEESVKNLEEFCTELQNDI